MPWRPALHNAFTVRDKVTDVLMRDGPRRLLAIVSTALMLTACHSSDDGVRQGWVEADPIFVGADEQGRLQELKVYAGEEVKKGSPLFTLDEDLQQAELMVKKTAVVNAQKNFDRAKELLKSTAGTQKAFDDSEAMLREATASLAAAEVRLARRKVFSPSDGLIEQLYYQPGETVLPGQPIVALLPMRDVKLRFFVPQALLPQISLGQTVGVSCDGCEDGLTAKVNFMAHHAEFTPPVIYSLDERQKLVFLIEAHPEHPEKFRVGQPVTITLPIKMAGDHGE
jgi:HlyD family secretion protein